MCKYINYFAISVDLLLTCLVLPFLLFSARLQRNRKKNNTIFFIGLEHVINKIAERAMEFEKKGFRMLFFSLELTGHRCSEDFYKPEIVSYSKSILKDTLIFFKMLKKEKPSYVEVYLEGNLLRQLLSLFLLKSSKTLAITIERGALSGFVFHTYKTSFVFKKILLAIFQHSHYIFYKEIYMLDWFKKNKIDESKLFLDHNQVSIKEEPIYTREAKNVLFLNGFWKYRRIDLLIEAIPLVVQKIKNVQFTLVGARNSEERKKAEELVKEAHVENNTTIYDWTNHAEIFYNTASVFVLPADIVFCNYSLLEAMERGVPAIVAQVRDADRIITHGIDGFLCPQDSKSIADYIIQLLSDENLRTNMGIMARKKIITTFNNHKRIDLVLSIIKKYENKTY